MTAAPAETPETTPVPVVIDAIFVFPVFHVPPADKSLKPVVALTQTVVMPAIAEGKGLTVTAFAAMHPVGSVYVITDVPALTPVSVPVVETIVAMIVLPLLHVPPDVPSLKVVVKPAHKLVAPVIATGKGFTTTEAVVIQPVDKA